ncbi:Transmembrane domain-containing protein [Spironucleus salmonicida]|nr:Transmembrane domain-containing protein [Spironucleus salmonicida]
MIEIQIMFIISISVLITSYLLSDLLNQEPSPFLSIFFSCVMIHQYNTCLEHYTLVQQVAIPYIIGVLYFMLQIKPIRARLLQGEVAEKIYIQTQFSDDIFFIITISVYPIIIEYQICQQKLLSCIIFYTVIDQVITILLRQVSIQSRMIINYCYIVGGFITFKLTNCYKYGIFQMIINIIMSAVGFGENMRFIFSLLLLGLFEGVQTVMGWETTSEYWARYFEGRMK